MLREDHLRQVVVSDGDFRDFLAQAKANRAQVLVIDVDHMKNDDLEFHRGANSQGSFRSLAISSEDACPPGFNRHLFVRDDLSKLPEIVHQLGPDGPMIIRDANEDDSK